MRAQLLESAANVGLGGFLFALITYLDLQLRAPALIGYDLGTGGLLTAAIALAIFIAHGFVAGTPDFKTLGSRALRLLERGWPILVGLVFPGILPVLVVYVGAWVVGRFDLFWWCT